MGNRFSRSRPSSPVESMSITVGRHERIAHQRARTKGSWAVSLSLIVTRSTAEYHQPGRRRAKWQVIGLIQSPLFGAESFKIVYSSSSSFWFNSKWKHWAQSSKLERVKRTIGSREQIGESFTSSAEVNKVTRIPPTLFFFFPFFFLFGRRGWWGDRFACWEASDRGGGSNSTGSLTTTRR